MFGPNNMKCASPCQMWRGVDLPSMGRGLDAPVMSSKTSPNGRRYTVPVASVSCHCMHRPIYSHAIQSFVDILIKTPCIQPHKAWRNV